MRMMGCFRPHLRVVSEELMKPLYDMRHYRTLIPYRIFEKVIRKKIQESQPIENAQIMQMLDQNRLRPHFISEILAYYMKRNDFTMAVKFFEKAAIARHIAVSSESFSAFFHFVDQKHIRSAIYFSAYKSNIKISLQPIDHFVELLDFLTEPSSDNKTRCRNVRGAYILFKDVFGRPTENDLRTKLVLLMYPAISRMIREFMMLSLWLKVEEILKKSEIIKYDFIDNIDDHVVVAIIIYSLIKKECNIARQWINKIAETIRNRAQSRDSSSDIWQQLAYNTLSQKKMGREAYIIIDAVHYEQSYPLPFIKLMQATKNDLAAAKYIFNAMQKRKNPIQTDVNSYSALFEAYAQVDDPTNFEEAERVFQKMVEAGIQFDERIASSFVSMYERAGDGYEKRANDWKERRSWLSIWK